MFISHTELGRQPANVLKIGKEKKMKHTLMAKYLLFCKRSNGHEFISHESVKSSSEKDQKYGKNLK